MQKHTHTLGYAANLGACGHTDHMFLPVGENSSQKQAFALAWLGAAVFGDGGDLPLVFLPGQQG